ncbi:hypothetical protein MMC13_007526 [Lambiella insularis]|nr:hypothetical protein [Lambiella insularis]
MATWTDEDSDAYEAKPEFEPSIENSIWQTGEGSWAIGSSMRCEVSTDRPVPEDQIASWKDADNVLYCLRPQEPRFAEEGPLEQSVYGPVQKPFRSRHWSSEVFVVGKDILIKVKYSPPGWYSIEGDALSLVAGQTPEVPIPECIHFWIDRKWNRSFLIMTRIHGVTLDDAWWGLSNEEKESVTDELADYQVEIARTITSPVFKGVNDTVPYKPYYFSAHDYRRGHWDPKSDALSKPLDSEQLREQMSLISGGENIPDIGSQFHLFHGDMNPRNVLLSVGERIEGKRDVYVAGIIDWEMASYVPHWWLTLFPTLRSSGAYWLIQSMEQNEANPYLMWEYVEFLNSSMVNFGWENGFISAGWFRKYYIGKQREEERRFIEDKLAGCVTWLSKTA